MPIRGEREVAKVRQCWAEFLDAPGTPDSEKFRSMPRTPGARWGRLGSVNGDPPKAKRSEIMMHPHLPGPPPLAVPSIGFSQNILMGPEVVDPVPFGDLPPLTRAIDRIFWVPSLQPWFGCRS